LTQTLGEYAPSYATIKNWVAKFKRGDFSTCVVPRPGRPKTVTTPPRRDYHLFPGLGEKNRHFSSDAEVIAAAETWLDGQSSDVFFFFFGRVAKVRATG
jgi:hypothetical protein